MATNEPSGEQRGAYKELKGVLASIETKDSWFHDDGFTSHANHVISRVAAAFPSINDIDSYRLRQATLGDGRPIVEPAHVKQKLKSLLGRIEGEQGFEEPESRQGSGHTFIQNQSQEQSQTLSLVLGLQERLINEIPNHEEGSKERTFLERMKESLTTIKSVTDILSSALKIGGDLGLDAKTIHALLGF